METIAAILSRRYPPQVSRTAMLGQTVGSSEFV